MAFRHSKKYASASENELMARFYGCDDNAFEELWECRLRGWLTKFVRQKVANPRNEDVEDIVSEVSLKVIETKHKPSTRFDPQKGNLRSWIARIALNEVANYFRKRGQETAFNELMKFGEEEEEIPDAPDGILADETDEEWKVIVQNAVRKLEEPSRTIVKLRFWEELTQEEIAKELGIPLATVNRRLKHDLAHLCKLLTH